MYEYRAKHKRTVDGDTIVVDIDLGFQAVIHDVTLRILGVDTPEKRSRSVKEKERARQAEYFTHNWCRINNPEIKYPLLVRTYKKDSFGRWLCDVYKDGESLSKVLIETGLGVEYVK